MAESAWCSTQKKTGTEEDVKRLLTFLAQNGHHTPFEKTLLHFVVTCDIATHVQLLKHRIGVSVNAQSARYREIKEDAYLVPSDFPDEWAEKLRDHTDRGLELYHQALDALGPVLGRPRAKEACRYFRGYNTQLVTDVSFNMRSFYHFYGLRATAGAQQEIRDLAEQMMTLLRAVPEFKHTLDALFGPVN